MVLTAAKGFRTKEFTTTEPTAFRSGTGLEQLLRENPRPGMMSPPNLPSRSTYRKMASLQVDRGRQFAAT